MEETKTRYDMGSGKLGSPTVDFGRNFRWAFGSDTLPKYYCKSVQFDHTNKLILLEYQDAHQDGKLPEGLAWVNKMTKDSTNEKLKFLTLDAGGQPLYGFVFSGIEIAGHKSSKFDYASSDVSLQIITIKYNNIELVQDTNTLLNFFGQIPPNPIISREKCRRQLRKS